MAVEVLGIVIGTLTVLGIIELRVKGLTKNYLEELKPNSGSSTPPEVKHGYSVHRFRER